MALGDNKIREWGDHYTQTGQLWTIEEATRIKTIALNYDFR